MTKPKMTKTAAIAQGKIGKLWPFSSGNNTPNKPAIAPAMIQANSRSILGEVGGGAMVTAIGKIQLRFDWDLG